MTGEAEKENATLTRYLLGELTGQESERVERSYFADDEAFDLALAAEDDLIDAYARGELPAPQRRRFEKLLAASPALQARVRFARDLPAALSRHGAADADAAISSPRPVREARHGVLAALRVPAPTFRFALAAGALAVACGLLCLFVLLRLTSDAWRPTGGEHAAVREKEAEQGHTAAGTQPRVEERAAGQAGTNAQPSPAGTHAGDRDARAQAPAGRDGALRAAPPVVSFVLTPGLVRDSGGRTLPVPRSASVVLRLNFEAGDFASFRAVLETADGREVWRDDSIRRTGRRRADAPLTLPAIPARTLAPGDYVLLLSGARADGTSEEVADYSFTVVRD